MPHDRKNNRLRPGDLVMIPGIVKGIDKHSTYVNIVIETSEGRHPDGRKELIQINARQVELISASGHSDPDMDVTAAISESGSTIQRETLKEEKQIPHDPEDIHG